MANPIKIYKTLEEAYNALLKGFRSVKNRDPNPIENEMIKAEAEGKIKSQGDNISIFPEGKKEGIMSQAPGIKSGDVVEAVFKPGMDKRGKMVKESPSQRQADLDRPFVTEEEMSAFTMEENARKLNKAKGFIDKLGAKTARQKLFVADLVEDAGTGVFQDVDMGAVVRSNMFDDLLEQGLDDDLLTNIMYSGTKSDDFATTLAKIRSNAMDEGVDIDETLNFYDRVFDEVSRVKKSMGGRMGYSIGSLPKGIQKLVQALNKKFGKDTVKTADEIDRPKDVQAFEDFETRNPNIESSELEKTRELAPKMVERFELKQKYPGINDELLTNIIDDPDPQHKAEVIATLEETFKMMQTGKGTDEIIDILEQGKKTRKDNAQGGLNYLMGL